MAVSSLVPAASGPTLAEINNSVATYAPSPNNWTLISTWTLGGTSSFTWSSLSGYKTYKIVTPSMYIGGASSVGIRINSDTNNNYVASAADATQNNFNNNTFFILSNPGNNTSFHFNLEINQANLAGNKSINAQYGDVNGRAYKVDGSYATNAAINSITIMNANSVSFSASNGSANLVHLYGAN